ncbi:MAG: response regulator [Clostridia bacterium]|nr:response regulator [Clostridia bacterium]
MTKVFLVDDEIVIREGIRSSFPWDESEYSLVGEAPDGEIALPMIRDMNPDILITDIRMPFMDGMELCRLVRSQMPWIGVIILSGYDEFEYARQAIQLGVREYLLKPITAEDLRHALDRVSAQLAEERRSRERSESLRRRMEGGSLFLREKLLSSLYSEDAGEADAEKTLRELSNMGLRLQASHYAVIDAAFDPVKTGYEVLTDLAENSGGVVFASPCRTGARLLILGNDEAETEERAYAFASSSARDLERSGCQRIRVSIGEIVQDPQDILKSLRTARHIRHSLADQAEMGTVIVGVREIGELPSEKKTLSVVHEAKFYLSQHFTDPNLMLQDVARAVSMSNSRFSTVFAQQSGKTFTEYLTALRLNRAKELLRTTEMRSAQIAFEVGYNDAHYFSYLFKKSLGLTPSEYRHAHVEDAAGGEAG